jgi:acyl-coenzyme A synthetase/AMP-(fatty) acid ligase
MLPHYIEFAGTLPKTPTLKVRKVDLRRRGVGENTWQDPSARRPATRPA